MERPAARHESSARGEAAWVAALTLFTAALRLWGRAASPWDWDEIQFMQALHEVDVAEHQPHPPGFPVFILAGRIARLVFRSDFTALQSVSIASSVALIPILWWFLREIGAPRLERTIALSLFAAFPTVVLYSGTAFSDVFSLTLALLSCSLLLSVQRRPSNLLMGAIVGGIAAGVRAQNLLFIAPPAFLAARRAWRERKLGQLAAAALTGAATIASAYGAVAIASGGVGRYLEAVRAHADYIRTNDTWRAPARPPLDRLVDDFFVKSLGAGDLNYLLALLAGIGLAAALYRRRRHVVLPLLIFGPFAALALTSLDHWSARRFMLPCIPFVALAVAEALAVLTEAAGRRRKLAAAVVTSLLCALLLARTGRGLAVVRAAISPPVAAMRDLRIRMETGAVPHAYVERTLTPFAEYYLPEENVTILPPGGLPYNPSPGVLVAERGLDGAGAMRYRVRRDPLESILRHRYFEVSVIPVRSLSPR